MTMTMLVQMMVLGRIVKDGVECFLVSTLCAEIIGDGAR